MLVQGGFSNPALCPGHRQQHPADLRSAVLTGGRLQVCEGTTAGPAVALLLSQVPPQQVPEAQAQKPPKPDIIMLW